MLHNPDFRGPKQMSIKVTERWRQNRYPSRPLKCSKKRRTKKFLAQFELTPQQKLLRAYTKGW